MVTSITARRQQQERPQIATFSCGLYSPPSPRSLNNDVAVPLMQRPETLGRAYTCLEDANALHIRLHGVPLPVATYNQACCLSLGADALLAAASEVGVHVVVPQLPLATHDLPVSERAEQHLDLAVALLKKAVMEGLSETVDMLMDADLKAVRDRRPSDFLLVCKLRKRTEHVPY